MPHDPVRVEDTRAWYVKASSDLRASETDLAAQPPLVEDALFHCQQAVEKAMKGFLTWHDVAFRKTHDLVEIKGQCASLDLTLEPLLDRAAKLTEYAWKFRYPGKTLEPSLEEARDTLALAREVFEAILARLPAEVRP